MDLISRRKTGPDSVTPAAAVLVTWPLALSSILLQCVIRLLGLTLRDLPKNKVNVRRLHMALACRNGGFLLLGLLPLEQAFTTSIADQRLRKQVRLLCLLGRKGETRRWLRCAVQASSGAVVTVVWHCQSASHLGFTPHLLCCSKV